MAKQERRIVAAIYILEAARVIAVAAEEKRGVAPGFGVFIQMPVHPSQQARQVLGIEFSRVAVQAALQVCHEQSGGNALAGNIRQNEAYLALPQIEKIVIISADAAGLNAVARVVEGLQQRLILWQQVALHGTGDGNLLQERFFTGPGEIEIPDIVLGIQTLHADLRFSLGVWRAHPDHAKHRAPLITADLHELFEMKLFWQPDQAAAQQRNINGAGRPRLFARSRPAYLHRKFDSNPFLAALITF